MFNGYFYHGTHSREWDMIKQNRDHLFELATEYENHSRWLSATGIYFFYENIIQALRFARKKSFKANLDFPDQNIKPVVFKTKLDYNCKVLSLFTPDGLNELWFEHQVYLHNLNKNYEHIRSDSKGYAESLKDSVLPFMGAQQGRVTPIDLESHENDRFTKQKINEFNIESGLIMRLCKEKRYEIVVGAIQESTTFNEQIHNNFPRTEGKEKKFRGFGYQDHIEVCVINPNVIGELVKCINPEDHNYEDIFFTSAISDLI